MPSFKPPLQLDELPPRQYQTPSPPPRSPASPVRLLFPPPSSPSAAVNGKRSWHADLLGLEKGGLYIRTSGAAEKRASQHRRNVSLPTSMSPMETFADIALATSPTYARDPRFSNNLLDYAVSPAPTRDDDERPSKRARSEVPPNLSSLSGTSRPATSYIPSANWSRQSIQGIDSRTNDAELLLDVSRAIISSHEAKQHGISQESPSIPPKKISPGLVSPDPETLPSMPSMPPLAADAAVPSNERPTDPEVDDAATATKNEAILPLNLQESGTSKTPVMADEVMGNTEKVEGGGTTETAKCAGCEMIPNSVGDEDSDEVSWISCDACKSWFHFACAGFTAKEVRTVDKYRCKKCAATHGATTYVRKSSRARAAIDYAGLNEGVIKTSDDSPEHPYIKPIKERTIQFLPETFPRMHPHLIDLDFFDKGNGMKEPIVIPAEMNPPRQPPQPSAVGEDQPIAPRDAVHAWLAQDAEVDAGDMILDEGQDGLDMVIPPHLTVRRVADLYGPEEKVPVIDVKSQGEAGSWNMRKWADYYESTDKKFIRNVISLEVSYSKLGRLIKRPKVVRELDLVDSVWPPELKEKGDFPRVQLYCLMSIADSYTDFHIDFGGSSVFYHILKGKKTFLFIPPKNKHLKKYEQWCLSPAQNHTFLPDQTKECYRVDLSAGDTMLIPSGWIHAVWTPEDSLVIGGNFLTRLHFGMQIQVAEIEKTTKVPRRFRQPHFQRILWFTVIRYLADDPTPPEVVEMLHKGEAFPRDTPPHLEIDAWGTNSKEGLGNFQTRFYSEFELDGLPALVRYVLRTALISMDKISDVTVETRKAVARAIPRGYGAPLDIVKQFALWTAWKRGNEAIPSWAFPGADPSTSFAGGGEKKMTAATLKRMERAEAKKALRKGPERQSGRTRKAAASILPAAIGETVDAASNLPEDARDRPDDVTAVALAVAAEAVSSEGARVTPSEVVGVETKDVELVDPAPEGEKGTDGDDGNAATQLENIASACEQKLLSPPSSPLSDIDGISTPSPSLTSKVWTTKADTTTSNKRKRSFSTLATPAGTEPSKSRRSCRASKPVHYLANETHPGSHHVCLPRDDTKTSACVIGSTASHNKRRISAGALQTPPTSLGTGKSTSPEVHDGVRPTAGSKKRKSKEGGSVQVTPKIKSEPEEAKERLDAEKDHHDMEAESIRLARELTFGLRERRGRPSF
ncbi:MAG: JmjC domain-containing histone demethylation protein 1 [Thelocarpon superellum]|nr:MAG: JmjC domain-containing histone demethylation protein 1 [Thelocarpon superellum]